MDWKNISLDVKLDVSKKFPPQAFLEQLQSTRCLLVTAPTCSPVCMYALKVHKFDYATTFSADTVQSAAARMANDNTNELSDVSSPCFWIHSAEEMKVAQA